MSQSKQSMRSALTPGRSASRRPLCAPRFVILAPVRVLYGALLLSTMAIVGVALAVARHIAQHRRAIRSESEHHDDPV